MKPAHFSGRATRFKGNGRKLGYPTANLSYETDLADGVYFGLADLKSYKKHPALIFIGVPTTLGDKQRRAEVYLLDIPDVDYYDENLSVSVLHFHRGNKKFSNLGDLVEAMHDDEKNSRIWFKSKDLLS